MTEITKVGEILPSNQPRDAIHIAVAAVVATEVLSPGQNIGFVEGAEHDHKTDVAACERAMSVGIVDPFLTSPIMPGQWFWMFLHPYTITSLRHNWTHPAFGSDGEPEIAVQEAEKWLRNFADECNLSYRDLMAAGKTRVTTGEGFTQYGSEEAQEAMWVDTNRRKFWANFEIVTGMKASDHDDQPFSCSC